MTRGNKTIMPIDDTSAILPKDGPGREPPPDIRLEINRLSNAVNAALKRAQKKIDHQIIERQEALSSTKYQQLADSILAHLSAIPSWTDSCEIVNVHTNEIERVKLNAQLSPKGNAELLYKKARKGVRGIKIIESRLSETKALIGRLESARHDLERLCKSEQPDAEIRIGLARVLPCLLAQGIGGTLKQGVARTKGPVPKHTPYRHITIEGWDLFIGCTDIQNDELTTRFARPSDIWMHVAAHSGSHVVIRRNKNTEWPPRKILELAASFAAWFSIAKHSSNVEVHLTEKRFVSKRRHSPAGQVMVTRFKTIMASPLSPQDYFRAHPEPTIDKKGIEF
jgi:predicted ribosome quality control (RQC) complex YloA/Tae2 family protein